MKMRIIPSKIKFLNIKRILIFNKKYKIMNKKNHKKNNHKIKIFKIYKIN